MIRLVRDLKKIRQDFNNYGGDTHPSLKNYFRIFQVYGSDSGDVNVSKVHAVVCDDLDACGRRVRLGSAAFPG